MRLEKRELATALLDIFQAERPSNPTDVVMAALVPMLR